MRGSPLGVGTDIGGSIRIPSAFNGLYGLKPTGTINPPSRKLRFGIISDNDGEISAHPPIVRGLAMTKKALEKAGHEVFEWSPNNHPEMVREMNNSFYTLGGAAILGLTKEHDEPVFGSMKSYERAYEQGEHGTLGPTKLREMITARNGFQKEYLDRWNATAEDGNQIMDDYPACTFPVTFTDKDVDKVRTDWKPLNKKDEALQADYDPEFYHGTPVALQCVGRRLEDEKVLDMVEIIANALRM
ncbi:putative Acetamidase [Glarea lozoyensis 74030]|uniref:Putative Acetamidase n=1 Tax=Glarea lozoyensis (strain ATCC 74030 / MF5533) TaxID=1104152 RepID=H0EUZ5_GLAL7|nr:putative Acetamidase [Glarea lozoyensis 74030]